MTILGFDRRGACVPARSPWWRARAAALSAWLLAALLGPGGAAGAPFIWDQDENRIDDRIETVHVLGYALAFEKADTLLRKRIEVSRAPALLYGVYVNYSQPPTDSDFLALAGLGMPVLHRYEELPSVRSVATFAQVAGAAALPGVERVEAIPILYPVARDGTAAAGVRDPSGQVFPTWSGMGGADGEGVVVAILDTGINDGPEGGYPGHESLIGRGLGGAVFTHGDSTLDTPRDGSVDPSDHGGGAALAHGTHVAGIILGSGGPTAFARGVAPSARFVDVKVLNDLGVGSGVAEALDWCIHNRDRDWGDPDPSRQGIDVINLSLSSLDRSDGNDLAARMANRAVERGIVVVASMGNESLDHYVPSPAAGDRVIAVGALDDRRTPLNDDDTFASLSNQGPRDADGDLDAADEQKPDLLAPGQAVLSADGDLASDGAQYRRASGTSMSAAFVSGAAAVLRSEYPSLTPAAIAGVLRATGLRPLADVPAGETGPDPGWHSAIGFGALDLHAARLELTQPGRTQVRRLELRGSGDEILATVRTQRERGAAFLVFERAPDQAGSPGAFAPYDSVPATGDPTLADGTNLQSYTRTWSVPAPERGLVHWYRIAYSEDGVRWEGPARPFRGPAGPPAATIEVTVVHNALDSDVDAAVELGAGESASGSPPALSFPLPSTAAAIASEWITGTSTAGNIAWTFAIEVPEGTADAYLPPGPAAPWSLRVGEGGFLNRAGRVTEFRVVWHAPGGDLVAQGAPLPLQTLEGQTVWAVAPASIVGMGAPAQGGAPRVSPNPLRGGGAVTFVTGRPPDDDLRVYDLSGRMIGRAPFRAAEGGWLAEWRARAATGEPLPAGLYFARAGAAGTARVVVLGR